jgi:hypothetical protein
MARANSEPHVELAEATKGVDDQMALTTSDILVTGPNRSGTTLLCACLNQLPDCLALAEPMSPPTQASTDNALRYISRFLIETRNKALAEKVATAKVADEGFDTANWFEQPHASGRLRVTREVVRELPIRKALSPGFKLVVKHPAFFTALAEPLQELYPLYAIVRDPLATLASWQTLDIPVHRGHWPVAEAFSPPLREKLQSITDPLDRQIVILRWCFEVYECLPRKRVLRYEDLVVDPLATLSDFHSGVESINVPIRIENPATRYASVNLSRLARALKPYTSDFEWIYPRFAENIQQHAG